MSRWHRRSSPASPAGIAYWHPTGVKDRYPPPYLSRLANIERAAGLPQRDRGHLPHHFGGVSVHDIYSGRTGFLSSRGYRMSTAAGRKPGQLRPGLHRRTDPRRPHAPAGRAGPQHPRMSRWVTPGSHRSTRDPNNDMKWPGMGPHPDEVKLITPVSGG